MEYLSNSPFTDVEFEHWKEEMGKSGLDLPTYKDLDDKKQQLKELQSYKHSQKEIRAMVKEKQALKKTPGNFALKKNEMLGEINKINEEKSQVFK